jgi:lysophospholipase L1-like esterase
MVRFVALGDSITAGLGDPMPQRTWRGWAALLAESLGPPGTVEFHNLAELGAQSHTLVETQLPTAVKLKPTVAAVIIGVNDTLRGSFHIGRTGPALNRAVRELRATGAIVLTCVLPDPGRMLRLPTALARQLARRIRAVNAITHEIAALHDTVHFDACSRPDIYDRRMWSIDRLHPSEAGHRMLARAFADLLAERGFPVHCLPSPVPTNPPPKPSESVRWMATKGTKWVLDRSTDLVPTLLAMCVAEWWHGAVGIASRIDQRLTEDVARTLGLLREELALRALRAELELFRGELAMTAAEHAAPAIEPASYAT